MPFILFGEMAQKWAAIISKKTKNSTMKDYRCSMNTYILPKFGNTPIGDINYLDVETFVAGLKCSPKRINNILVPMGGVFRLAFKTGLIEKNVMSLVENRKLEKRQIHPLSLDEVHLRAVFRGGLLHGDEGRGDGSPEVEERGPREEDHQDHGDKGLR